MKARDGSEETPFTLQEMLVWYQKNVVESEGPYEGGPIFYGRYGRKEGVLVSPEWFERMQRIIENSPLLQTENKRKSS